jgi:hypothetical protein
MLGRFRPDILESDMAIHRRSCQMGVQFRPTSNHKRRFWQT